MAQSAPTRAAVPDAVGLGLTVGITGRPSPVGVADVVVELPQAAARERQAGQRTGSRGPSSFDRRV